jgi:predicted metal-dependent phosphoesterase TrpH
MLADLHTHTLMSDGTLAAEDLLQRAEQQGVELLAITDHDTVAAYQLGQAYLDENPLCQLRLVAGVEFSCVWGKMLVHIVGLNIDLDNAELAAGLLEQARARDDRGRLIGEKLAKLGFEGAFEGAAEFSGGGQIGRPHFARYLVEQGHVKDFQQAFKKYLGAGKPGDVKTLWPAMQTVVQWIAASGGVAVIAHPQRYKMTATKLRALMADFKAAGGQAIEVISGSQDKSVTEHMVRLCDQYQFLASIGSDFHRPGAAWSELGCSGQLPAGVTPVWDHF